MNKNTVIGFVLMALVLFGYTYYATPSAEQQEAMRHYNDSIAAVNAQMQQANEQARLAEQQHADSIAQNDTTSLFSASLRGTGQPMVLENNVVKLTFNTLGGSIEAVELKEYKNQQKQPVMLFDKQTARMNYALCLSEGTVNTAEHVFTAENVTDSTITMRLLAKSGSCLVFDYKLIPDNYMVNLNIHGEGGLERFWVPDKKYLYMEWQDSVRQQEKGYTFESRYSRLTYKERDGGIDYLTETKAKEEKPEKPLDWIAFKNQFFSHVLISYQGFTEAHIKSTPLAEGSGYLKYDEAYMKTAFDPSGKQPTQLQLYLGPNKFRLLQSMNKFSLVDGKDLDLDHLVDLGWPIVRWINRFFTIYVFDWFTRLGLPMGIVLLLITILLKVLVYPTTRKSYMSSAKMRVLKPKLDELNEKYPNKEDALKKQQEMMSIYSQYGVSPMGGCLPILLQMPIWIAMFNFVPNAIELRQQSFLWADDLSTYDDVLSWGSKLPLIGNHLSIFCLLFCVSNLLYSWINMKQQRDSMMGQQAEQMKMMQWMMMLMPLFFFFIFNDYSSGLNYYYFISLLASAVTMWWLRWRTDDKKLLAKLEENYQKNKNNPKKVSGLAARLEALQKQQEQQQQRMKRR